MADAIIFISRRRYLRYHNQLSDIYPKNYIFANISQTELNMNTKPLRIVVAFDSFKGCISAEEACKAAAEGIRDVCPEADVAILPLSDGGEGLVDCVRRITNTIDITLDVHGPLMEMVRSSYAMSVDGKTAYMEMASASGLTLVPQSRRNPMVTTTYGVGEMIADAVGRGCEQIVMGIGGSATCDAGEGMLKALRDKNCMDFPNKIVVACDVNNPLFGENGAAYVFAPQKGATAEQVVLLDKRLRDFARRTEVKGIALPEMANHPGAGAAGGLGYALLCYLKAELRSGIDIILDIAQFDKHIADADIVVSGEGKSDAQTMMGKVPSGVLRHCKKNGVKTWLLSGAVDDANLVLTNNFDLVKSINQGDHRPLSLLLEPDVAKENIRKTMRSLMKNNMYQP